MALGENSPLANQSAPVRKIKCLRCKKDTFKSANALANHQDSLGHHHAVCPTCSKEFGSEKARDDHQKSSHRSHNLVTRPVCHEKFGTKKARDGHKKSHEQRSVPKKQKTVISTGAPPLGAPASGPAEQHEKQENKQLQSSQKPNNQHPKQQQAKLSTGEHLLHAYSHAGSAALHGYLNSTGPVDSINEVQLYYNGNFFRMLTPTEQGIIYANLQAKCHTATRLQTQGYTMPTLRDGIQEKVKKASIARSKFQPTPVPSPASQHLKRRAVVIDCEMVEVRKWQREIALLSAVDFLTGEVLINNYVQPTAKVTNWMTKISGVTPAAMAEAVSKGQALRGWQSARQALFNYVDANTILIGHSLNNDLDVLGIYHTNIVDSVILASEAVFGSTSIFKRLYGLKTLSEEFLKLHIQPKNHAHICLEDTFATREVVISFLQNPEGLETWATGAEAEYAAQQKRREAERRQKKEEDKAKAVAELSPVMLAKLSSMRVVEEFSGSDGYGYKNDSETLRWSDIAEDCGWPNPDTGYDPWSD
ncbi:hypothetical protein BBP40_005195 [Aspergillus hancockii]|nr:hypothetical protein BBP40_005195 [Aspergillus hancockii]